MHAIQLGLNKFQLIYGVRNHKSGYLWGEEID